MRWRNIFFNNTCIICGEKTPYYVCDKCREAILQVRERFFPIEEELDSSNFITGFFTKKKKKKKKYANSP